jgi:hypothetical protein
MNEAPTLPDLSEDDGLPAAPPITDRERDLIRRYLQAERLSDNAKRSLDEAADSYDHAMADGCDDEEITQGVSDRYQLAMMTHEAAQTYLGEHVDTLSGLQSPLGAAVRVHLEDLRLDAQERSADARTRWEEGGRSGDRSDYTEASALPTLAKLLTSWTEG